MKPKSKPIAVLKFDTPTLCGSGLLHPFFKDYLGYCFYKAAAHIRAAVDLELSAFGVVAPQFGMLSLLQAQGPLTQGELGHYMAIDKATMVRMIDGLESKKFLSRVPSKKDRRVNRLEVTNAGLQAMQKMNEARKRAELNFLKDLSVTEQKQLRAIIVKLVAPASRT